MHESKTNVINKYLAGSSLYGMVPHIRYFEMEKKSQVSLREEIFGENS